MQKYAMLSAVNCPVLIIYIHIMKLLFVMKARTALSAKNSVTGALRTSVLI